MISCAAIADTWPLVAAIRSRVLRASKHSGNCGSRQQLMLPNPNHAIPHPSEGSCPRRVASHVQRDLASPIPRVRFWKRSTAVPASVPEASVYENNDPALSKNKVRPAREVARVHRPSRNAQPNQRCPDSPLRRSVSLRADSRHALTSLSWSQRIHATGMNATPMHSDAGFKGLLARPSPDTKPSLASSRSAFAFEV